MDRADEIQAGQNEFILFVDDEDLIVEIGKATLEQLGYQVFATTFPQDALDEFKAHPDDFKLVITDMTMPQITGEELAKEINRIRPDIPIIMCTGYNDNIDEDKAMEHGILKYIMKPFTITKITDAIREILDQQNDS